jgi:hypothetical protein
VHIANAILQYVQYIEIKEIQVFIERFIFIQGDNILYYTVDLLMHYILILNVKISKAKVFNKIYRLLVLVERNSIKGKR